jgi:type III secretory pathway component EscS
MISGDDMNKCCKLAGIFFLCAGALFSQEAGEVVEVETPLSEAAAVESLEEALQGAEAAPVEAKVPEGPQIDVFTEVSTDYIEQNVPFSITVMVNHPNPVEVRVQPPDFEDNFSMERLKTEAQLVKNDLGSERWTRVEFQLMPLTAGTVYLGSFEVAIPGRTAATRRMLLKINNEKSGKSGRLQWIGLNIWNGPPASIYVGEAKQVGLRLLDLEQGTVAPKQLPLRIEAPENAVIEELPISAADREIGICFRMSILPLDERDVRIASHSFRIDGRTLVVPALSIKVLKPPEMPTPKNNLPVAPMLVLQEIIAPLEPETIVVRSQIPFPNYNEKTFSLADVAYKNTMQTAETFWQNGSYAESLAALRKGERDLAAGLQIAPIRKAAETALGLTSEPNEHWHPHIILLVIGCASLIALLVSIIIAILALQKKQKHTRKFTGKIFAVSIIFALIALGTGFWIMVPTIHTTAVVKEGFASAVPEQGRETGISFLEGQKVDARVKTKDWVYVESAKGKAGWVPANRIVYY